VRQMQGGTGHGGSFSAEAPAGRAGAHGAGQAPEADIAALATRLIMQSHGAVVAAADVNVPSSGWSRPRVRSGATRCATATNR
jgi:hypothetical protein